jgi:hypothetical protein
MSWHWSLSALSLFERCKFAYWNRYILKIRDERPRGGPAARGTDIHKGIELHLTEGHPLPGEVNSWWSSAFTEIKQYPFWTEHQIGLDRNWMPTAWDEAWLQMIIDLKVKKPGGYTVVDWKTGKEYPEHYEQKELYALGVHAEHPEENSIAATHVYLDLFKQTKRDYHRDTMPARRTQWNNRVAKLEKYIKDGDKGQWIMEKNHFCKWCQFSKANGGTCKF